MSARRGSGSRERPAPKGLLSNPLPRAPMEDAPRAYLSLRYVILATLTLLVGQYLLGLWTNAYAPSSFTSSTSYPSLDWHYNVGYALFFLALAAVVLAALTRELRLVAPALTLLASVVLAGVFGMMFVASAPNNPLDAFGMGVMFLVAFGSAVSIAFSLRRRSTGTSRPSTDGASTGPTA